MLRVHVVVLEGTCEGTQLQGGGAGGARRRAGGVGQHLRACVRDRCTCWRVCALCVLACVFVCVGMRVMAHTQSTKGIKR